MLSYPKRKEKTTPPPLLPPHILSSLINPLSLRTLVWLAHAAIIDDSLVHAMMWPCGAGNKHTDNQLNQKAPTQYRLKLSARIKTALQGSSGGLIHNITGE